MIQELTDLCTAAGDFLLAWLLHISPDVALLFVAAVSTAVIVLVRPLTTD